MNFTWRILDFFIFEKSLFISRCLILSILLIILCLLKLLCSMSGPKKAANIFLSSFNIKLLLIFIILYLIDCVFVSIVLIKSWTFLFLDFTRQLLRHLEHYRRHLSPLEVYFKFHQKVELMEFQHYFVFWLVSILNVFLIAILITKWV